MSNEETTNVFGSPSQPEKSGKHETHSYFIFKNNDLIEVSEEEYRKHVEEGRKYKRVEEQNQETELTGGLEQQEVAEHPELSKILEQAKILHNEIWAKETFTPKDYVCQARLYKLWRELEDPWYMRNPENEVLDLLRKTGKLEVLEAPIATFDTAIEKLDKSEKFRYNIYIIYQNRE